MRIIEVVEGGVRDFTWGEGEEIRLSFKSGASLASLEKVLINLKEEGVLEKVLLDRESFECENIRELLRNDAFPENVVHELNDSEGLYAVASGYLAQCYGRVFFVPWQYLNTAKAKLEVYKLNQELKAIENKLSKAKGLARKEEEEYLKKKNDKSGKEWD